MDAEGDWRQLAACIKPWRPTGMTADAWFPEIGAPGDFVKQVKAVCRSCPVRVQCKVVGKDERFGIWGGQHKRERAEAKNLKRPETVSSLGAQRRLQALARLGWNGREVSLDIRRYTGMSVNPKRLDGMREGAEDILPVEINVAIERAFKHLRGLVNPGSSSRATSEMAARNGWPGPRSWRGVDIEDPEAMPNV